MSFFDDLASVIQQQPTTTNSPGANVAIMANQVGTGIDMGGQIIGAMNHADFGRTAQAADQFQAAQLRQNAGQAQASSQVQAYAADLQGKYAMSSALATAAASGGGASDPTVVNLIARNAGVTAYQKAVALYGGDEKARLANMQADAKEYQGATTKANSDQVAGSQLFSAGSTLMKGFARDSSLFQRFGAGGPGDLNGAAS